MVRSATDGAHELCHVAILQFTNPFDTNASVVSRSTLTDGTTCQSVPFPQILTLRTIVLV